MLISLTPRVKSLKIQPVPLRKVIFANNEVYHVLNRGVAQSLIFSSTKEYQRFLNLIDFYRYINPSSSFSYYSRLALKDKEKFLKNLKKKGELAEIFAYCLMPNHFHLLLKQLKNKGIPILLANLQNSYARYFNLKNQRAGPLFQSRFKAVRIQTDEQLLHVSRYIHLNPTSSYLIRIKDLSSYPWSSFPEYLSERESIFINPRFILELAGGKTRYRKFVFNQAEYQRELNKIKHLSLENS